MKPIYLIGLALLLPAAGQERGQLDSNASLFAVMTAIDAAGFSPDTQSPANHPLRAKVRDYIIGKKPDSLAEIKRFCRDHPEAGLSHYISYALTLEGPPAFNTSKAMKDPPPDAAVLEGLAPLLAKLWSEVNLDAIWKEVQPAYEDVIARSFHDPVTKEILRVNAYLRNPTSGYLGRRFQIYVELMAPPNQVHTRSFGDDFFILLTPTPEPQIADIRRAYLFYLLDPLSIKFSKQIKTKDGLLQFAQAAPALDAFYKQDFYLLTTASLVRAIDARLTPGSADARRELVDQALREGFILTPYFYEYQPVYEKQERAMRLHYPEMIEGINLKQEDKRLENVKWAEKKYSKSIQVVTEVKRPASTGAQRTLEEAEDLYNQKQYPRAKDRFTKVLRETESKSLHAQAYYGLARIAALDKEAELSFKLFEKTLELSPEPEIKAWTLVFMGSMLYQINDLEPAVERYQAALDVEGIPAKARAAAEKGLREAKSKLPKT